MKILARINGYYSPYFPQSIMEEEAMCLYGTNFSFAERDFFLNKLLKENPNMSKAAINHCILGETERSQLPMYHTYPERRI